ncbi:hypothetical protein GGU11DRAFT_200378 [Lentinula aff. detonsa]|nr:hypothetical protein GGU11DRAFT_200378 [Lentinula aff. detonsa]
MSSARPIPIQNLSRISLFFLYSTMVPSWSSFQSFNTSTRCTDATVNNSSYTCIGRLTTSRNIISISKYELGTPALRNSFSASFGLLA